MANARRAGMRDRSKVYLIHVEGSLDGAWSDRLGGMQITVTDVETEPQTELVGRLIDQSALMGVLSALYDLGLSIVSVSTLSDPTPGPTRSPAARPPTTAESAHLTPSSPLQGATGANLVITSE